MKKKNLISLVFLLSWGLLSFGGSSVHAKTDKKAKEEKKDSVKTESSYEKLMKEKPETHEGFITLLKSKGKVYFQIPLDIMGREMLMGSTLSEVSDNGNGLVGSKSINGLLHISFEKLGEKVNMIQVNKDFITDSDRPEMAKALDINSAGSVIASFKIHSYVPDSTAVLFDATDFFVSDNKKMRPFDDMSLNTLMGRAKLMPEYQSQNSFLGDVKAFETNISIKSTLSYKYSVSYGGRNILEDEPYSAVVTRSILLLDEKPYKTRPTDSRIAIFPTGKILFSEKEQKSEVVYFANRWRLEPSDTAAYRAGKLVDPIKPIVFYIDPAFPKEWQPAIYEAVNQWQEPFEKIGFSNAICAKPFPEDDPEFDPDNLKYSCIRYAPVTIENAMGPSWVDPRSGEIINASVYVYHDVIKLVNNWRFVQTAQADPRVRSGKLPDDLLHESMRYVIGHEVGHCLGLMHNMSSSATIPVDSLRSPTFTQKYGTTHSIMDYARYNYVAQPGDLERGVKLTPPKFGLYDYFTIDYAYRPIFDVTPEDEKAILSAKLSLAQADPIYRYGKQQGSILDPRSQNEDLGDNSVKASEYGVKSLQYIIPNIDEWVVDDDDYSYRKEIYEAALNQYLTYVRHVFSNIGGINLWEKHEGDPVEVAYKCVPRETQKEAFEFMCNQLKDLKWLDNEELLSKIQLAGLPSRNFERAIVEAIVAAPAKLLSCEMLGYDEEIYTTSECMKDLYDFVWESAKSGKKLTNLDMMLQREYVRRVFGGAGFKYTGTGAEPSARRFAIVDDEDNAKAGVDAANPYAGYDTPYVMFVTQPSFDSEYYKYAMKVKKLVEKKASSSKGEEKAHYELIAKNIKNTLK
ncbi:MAG: zinc-dependent metalloprotease [Bacteroidales bacterium]|nr:zinc-dependent metalloprotease [Bacteroidales bacterium]